MTKETPTTVEGAMPSPWTDYITPFATAIGKSEEEVTTALKPLVGEPGEQAIDLLKNEEFTPFEEIKSKFDSVPVAVLKMAVQKHLRVAPEPVAASAVAPVPTATLDALPPVPADDAWLTMLRTGGELKVSTTHVISAVRAALASRSNLYDLPNELVERMESHAEALEEPVGEDFFALRKLITQRSYAEIFAALKVDGQFVTQRRKGAFLTRLDEHLWPALLSFQDQLKAWTESWQQTMGNPAAMMGAFAAMAGGGAMPPGMMTPPPTDSLRDAAEAVNDRVNKVFAGIGIPVSMALAYDAQRIKEVLENPSLPMQIGAVNREQMLKMLGVDVSSDYVRLERNVTRYALSIFEFPKVTSGQEELAYLTSLLMLGSQIPWDKLSGSSRSSHRRGTRRDNASMEV